MSLNQKIANFASWINNNIVGNPVSLVVCIVFVAVIYALMIVQGYSKWNLSTGLVGNDIESAYELITGTASVVAVMSLHKVVKDKKRTDAAHQTEITSMQAAHTSELKSLHAKLDSVLGKKKK